MENGFGPMTEQKTNIVCFTLWFRNHNNPRYADLFPRLSSVVQFRKVTLSRHRIVRGGQYRLWHSLRQQLIYPRVLRYLANRFETLFTVDWPQIPMWPRHKKVVIDIDDPVFSREEFEALNLPHVKAVIVTTQKAKTMFQQMGVNRPIHVIPQGVAVGQTNPGKIEAIQRQFKNDDHVIVGYHAPTLTMSTDGSNRRRSDQDDLDFLLTALEDARKMEPQIKLWLFGEPSEALRKYVFQGRDSWAKLFGYVPFSEMLNYLANVDIGVYPRTWNPPPARFSVKIAQFMACGIPVVSRELDEGFIINEAGCGVLCKTQADFSLALIDLAQTDEKRRHLGHSGQNYARAHLDWSVLVPAYKEILTS
jgi:glycosyltransferase involved in cell wall biosynthesis